MAVKTYAVQATREGSWWALYVPDLDIATQSRRLDQAEAMVRDLIATWREVSPDSFKISVIPQLDDVTRRAAEEVKALQAAATSATEQASTAARVFAARLLSAGYTVRDAGAILNVSPQRISQLTAANPARKTAKVAAASAKSRASAKVKT
jgi:hypothetical protein